MSVRESQEYVIIIYDYTYVTHSVCVYCNKNSFFFKKKPFILFQIYFNRDHRVLLRVYSNESKEDAMRK